MTKLAKALGIVALVAVSTSASAWWGGGPWGNRGWNNDGWGDGWGDGWAHRCFRVCFRMVGWSWLQPWLGRRLVG